MTIDLTPRPCLVCGVPVAAPHPRTECSNNLRIERDRLLAALAAAERQNETLRRELTVLRLDLASQR